MGRPRCLDTSDDLFRKFVILESAGRVRREAEDRLFVRRALFQPNASRDDRPEHLRPENLFDVIPDVPPENRALVMNRDDDPEKLEARIRPGLDLLERFE